MSKKETTVHRMVVIDAPPETIWNALNADGLSSLHLLREEGDQKLQEGRSLAWFAPDDQGEVPRIKGRITVISKPRRIAFMAFMPSTGLPDIPQNYTLVDIQLRPEDDGRTLVKVEHGDFADHPNGTRLAKQAGDNWVEALIRLKERVEHGAAA
jgi:uncharacterized protein YndB with AHSA1/START domain